MSLHMNNSTAELGSLCQLYRSSDKFLPHHLEKMTSYMKWCPTEEKPQPKFKIFKTRKTGSLSIKYQLVDPKFLTIPEALDFNDRFKHFSPTEGPIYVIKKTLQSPYKYSIHFGEGVNLESITHLMSLANTMLCPVFTGHP